MFYVSKNSNFHLLSLIWSFQRLVRFLNLLWIFYRYFKFYFHCSLHLSGFLKLQMLLFSVASSLFDFFDALHFFSPSWNFRLLGSTNHEVSLNSSIFRKTFGIYLEFFINILILLFSTVSTVLFLLRTNNYLPFISFFLHLEFSDTS